jgi:glycosyltransferase involved in cell wall biosynthesis
MELCGAERCAGSWVRIVFRLQRQKPIADQTSLCFDFGSGYSETNSILLPAADPRTGWVDVLLALPPGVRAVRLDPGDESGEPPLSDVRVAPVGRIELAFRMAWAIIRYEGAARFIGILGGPPSGLLTSEGRRRIKAALANGYRRGLPGSDRRYLSWLEALEPHPPTYRDFGEASSRWSRRPLISILMPVFETPERFLREAIESVLRQAYPHWQLCIADDASRKSSVRKVLEECARRDSRIHLVFRDRNGHISEATNSALELATGEFVALLDHDDVLHPLALHYVAEAIVANPDANLIFSDEDRIDEVGRRHNPYFKSDFNYELFLAQNMVCHLGTYRRELVLRSGALRVGFEGAQDWDLALRVVEQSSPQQIVHIPRVLYHWRALPGSAAWGSAEKPYAVIAGRRAIADHLRRIGKDADVMPAPEAPAMNRVRYRLGAQPMRVSIIISPADRAAACIESIQKRTRYSNYEIAMIEDGGQGSSTDSAVTNRAVKAVSGGFVCLIDSRFEILTPEWIEEMLSFAAQKEVGAVGGRLRYPDGSLLHAGIVLGIFGSCGHAHRFLRHGASGYFGRAVLHQTFSAVDRACLMIRRQTYEEVGGFDEGLGPAFNGVDFCLRVASAGYRNVWTPYAELTYCGTNSSEAREVPNQNERAQREAEDFKRRWGQLLPSDPAYSPNLTLLNESFSMAWPPRPAGTIARRSCIASR